MRIPETKTNKVEKKGHISLGVQIISRRLTKVGATSKFWLKLTDDIRFRSFTINVQFLIKNGGNLFIHLIENVNYATQKWQLCRDLKILTLI